MAATVNIYLPIEATNEWVHILAIPHTDVNRLTFRPLKWLRFAVFAVCGAKGHLSTTPGGDIADYEHVLLEDLADAYYYTPEGTYHFVDYKVLDGRDPDMISDSSSGPREEFYQGVLDRDHACVFTRDEVAAIAAHIIPASKGDAFITFVVQGRSQSYERLPFSCDENVDIDAVENGMLLRVDLYAKFRRAYIAFLKTPNFAMVPDDVKSFGQRSSSDRTTLQWMMDPILYGARSYVPQVDALPDWRNEVHSPQSILLDYMYGVAVVKHWKTDRLPGMLEEWFEHTFKSFLDNEQNARTPRPKGNYKRRFGEKFSWDAEALEDLVESMNRGEVKGRPTLEGPQYLELYLYT